MRELIKRETKSWALHLTLIVPVFAAAVIADQSFLKILGF